MFDVLADFEFLRKCNSQYAKFFGSDYVIWWRWYILFASRFGKNNLFGLGLIEFQVVIFSSSADVGELVRRGIYITFRNYDVGVISVFDDLVSWDRGL